MNYSAIKKNDIANGLGVRVTLFVSGCNHRCRGCFNSEAWDFDAGEPFTEAVIDEIMEALNNSYVQGLSILGGEPLERVNIQGVLPLFRRFKEAHPEKDIWVYTGSVFEKDVLGYMYGDWPEIREYLSYVDILVDGPFVEELKSLKLKFKGSSNQRLIDLKATLKGYSEGDPAPEPVIFEVL